MNNPSHDASALLEAVKTLTIVLEQENAALLNADFSTSGKLADAKRAAIKRMESLVATASDPATRTRAGLPTIQRRLDDAVSQNRVLLQRSIDTQQRVIATIVRALEPEDDDSCYPAQYGTDNAHRPPLPIALTLRA